MQNTILPEPMVIAAIAEASIAGLCSTAPFAARYLIRFGRHSRASGNRVILDIIATVRTKSELHCYGPFLGLQNNLSVGIYSYQMIAMDGRIDVLIFGFIIAVVRNHLTPFTVIHIS